MSSEKSFNTEPSKVIKDNFNDSQFQSETPGQKIEQPISESEMKKLIEEQQLLKSLGFFKTIDELREKQQDLIKGSTEPEKEEEKEYDYYNGYGY